MLRSLSLSLSLSLSPSRSRSQNRLPAPPRHRSQQAARQKLRAPLRRRSRRVGRRRRPVLHRVRQHPNTSYRLPLLSGRRPSLLLRDPHHPAVGTAYSLPARKHQAWLTQVLLLFDRWRWCFKARSCTAWPACARSSDPRCTWPPGPEGGSARPAPTKACSARPAHASPH